MARAPAIDINTLKELGLDKLAALVLDQSDRNPAFRKLVKAALAGAQGPDAVAKLIDKRLQSLERAKAFVDWNKGRAFRDDLQVIVDTILAEIAPGSASMAVDRLVRFIGTHGGVFDRIDDSSGRIQDVYRQAVEQLGSLVPRLAAEDVAHLPERLQAALIDSEHSYLVGAAHIVLPHLSDDALRDWDKALIPLAQPKAEKPADGGYRYDPVERQASEIRQLIARKLGDIDTLIAIEAGLPEHRQNAIAVAELLLSVGRAEEALVWARKKPSGGLRVLRMADFADGLGATHVSEPGRVEVEARILDVLGDRQAAQALRWAQFEATLDPDMLRLYLGALGDFEEFEALDRAFAHVSAAKNIYRALSFFMVWPCLDLAAALVERHAGTWSGAYFDMLSDIAEALENEHPQAATILYRALLDDILARARSSAYGHGARHLARLRALDKRLEPAVLERLSLSNHATYELGLQKDHGRKSAFWSKVEKR